MESFSTTPLGAVIPAYLYDQYNDDPNLQAFISTYNAMANGYLDWFNATNLAVYTSGAITGPLLDWTANNIYGIGRPVTSSQTARTRGPIGTAPINTMAINQYKRIASGRAQVATDDIYKRTMTWTLFAGLEKGQMNITWLKKRIARFLYGVDGADVDVSLTQNVSIQPTMFRQSAGIGTRPINTRAIDTLKNKPVKNIYLKISVPNLPISTTFAALLNSGTLPMPMQVTWTVQQ